MGPLDRRSDEELVALCNSGDALEAARAFETLYRRHRDFVLRVARRFTRDRELALDAQMVFVVDTSGSMAGEPIAQARDAINAALDKLESRDTFQIMNFSSHVEQFASRPLLATRDNIARARDYVRHLGGGGTEMLSGIRAALGFARDAERTRYVTFLTDGYIGNDVRVRGRLGAEPIAFEVGTARDTQQSALRSLWARLRVEDLARRQNWAGDTGGELARAIRVTALEHGLMSAYTSFVAVDASERTAGERGTTVNQAVPVPNGVRYQTTVNTER